MLGGTWWVVGEARTKAFDPNLWFEAEDLDQIEHCYYEIKIYEMTDE